MKTFIVEVTDESKVEFVETRLSQLDGVAYKEKQSKKKENTKKAKKKSASAKSPKGKSVKEVFAHTLGIWKDRDIDARELRRKAWGY